MMMEDIYANEDLDPDNKTETENSDANRHQPLHNGGSECVRSRRSRAATVCLGLLCVLLLAAVIVLCVQIITERDPFHIKSKNYTEEREQLLTKITNLTEEREQLLTNNTKLTEERDQLLTNNTKLTEERDQIIKTQLNEKNKLISENDNLTKQRELIQEKHNLLKFINKTGWIYYQFSVYFISSEKKSWSESRRDCLQRGADLIIINNREEQDFVDKFSCNNYIWIGLSDSAEEGTWKWVDNSTLTSGFRFWYAGDPNGGRKENCVYSYSSGWLDYSCDYNYQWVCEKSF